MNIIFLDVDGVLNSFRNIAAFGRFPFPGVLNNVPCQNIGPESELDPIAIGMIRKLCELCNAKIVLHSMWRRHVNFDEFGKRHNLPIIDATSNSLEKHIGIFDWLCHADDVEKFAIIDDNPILSVQFHPSSDVQAKLWLQMKDSFIQTNMHNGFTFLDFVNTFLIFSELDIDQIREKGKRLEELRNIDWKGHTQIMSLGKDERSVEQIVKDETEQKALIEELGSIGNWAVTILSNS